MIYSVILLLSALAYIDFVSNSDAVNRTDNKKAMIINGKIAEEHDAPFMVQIYMKNYENSNYRFYFGAPLIGKQTVLTAFDFK